MPKPGFRLSASASAGMKMYLWHSPFPINHSIDSLLPVVLSLRLPVSTDLLAD
ncbi:MAG: hypothetical protein V5A47_09975 [Bacteroidales bacterium]